MAHSAYPELGDSAIDKLLDALARYPPHPAAGRRRCSGPSTLNIGTISRRPRAQRDRRRSAGRDHDPPGGRFRRHQGRAGARPSKAAPNCAKCSKFPPLRLGALDGIRDHGGRVHHRYSGVRRHMGRAVPHRPRHHSRRAHARRARAQTAVARSRRNLSAHGQGSYANDESK